MGGSAFRLTCNEMHPYSLSQVKSIQKQQTTDMGSLSNVLRGSIATAGAARRADERARPFSDEFWCFGPDKGPSIVFRPGNKGGWRAAAAIVVEVVSAVRATHPAQTPPYISHACARARDTQRCGVDGGVRGRWVARAAERKQRERVLVGCPAGTTTAWATAAARLDA